jgi:2-methylcitrate dehydratase PrpD
VSIARHLAVFARTQWQDLPADVQRETVRAFVNWTGCAIGGARTLSAETAISGLLAMSGPGNTPVLGRSERLQPGDAALANCLISAADTYDDTHLSTITHPTGPVAAAILAIADTRRIAGSAFLGALAIGIEIECRISAAITAPGSGAHQGLYITGVSGGIGAAAAASVLLGASEAQIVTAIGLAAAQAAGFRATHGSMAIASPPAFAARNGLVAAHLAMAGFGCGDSIIEGKNGVLPVLAPTGRAEAIVDGLGTRFELLGNAFKPYPCGIVIHPSIDACIDIAGRIASADAIADVRLAVHADALALCWRKLPNSALEAQVSLYHWAAAALVRGRATLDEGDATAVEDPRIRAMQALITAETDPALASGQARAVVTVKDGSVVTSDVTRALGSLERPMSDDQLSEKFRKLACYRLTEEATAELLQACWAIAAVDEVGQLARSAALP